MAYSGKYIVENVNKYIGDIDKVVFRSLWERKVMKYLDKTENILHWNSEEIIIPYISPLDNKQHRYFVDFYAEVKTKDNNIEHILIEVKPYAQTQPPKKKKRITRGYAKSVKRYVVNTAKWEEAERYCKNRGWKFKIFTEHEIFGKKKKNGKKNKIKSIS